MLLVQLYFFVSSNSAETTESSDCYNFFIVGRLICVLDTAIYIQLPPGHSLFRAPTSIAFLCKGDRQLGLFPDSWHQGTGDSGARGEPGAAVAIEDDVVLQPKVLSV